MLGKVFKAYDVRGVYPDPLDEKMAWQIGWGASRFLLNDAKAAGEGAPMMSNIVVGRDMRASSPALAKSLIAGINAQGGNVIDIGMVDTPFIYFAVNYLDCAGGVMTTASHNPPQYNGFKISKRRAKPVGEASGLAEVRKFAAMSDPEAAASANPAGRVEQRDLWDAYTKHVRHFLDLGGRKLRVVVDASNGMAGAALPRLFGRGGSEVKGLEIIELNFEHGKGVFAHEPNPLVAANLVQLQQAVAKHKADLGVCFDGDADRCALVDETGATIGGDHLTALLAQHFLARSPGAAVVYDLRSTKAVPEAILAAGGRPVRCRVGHVFMKSALVEEKAVFGGELSGHFYFADSFNTDSGVIAMAVVLSVLARSNKKMSTLVKPFRAYAQSGEINFHNEDKDAALATLQEAFADTADIDELDGVTIDCFRGEGWWCNARKSNTEPLIRLNIEAKDARTLGLIADRIAPMLGERVDH